MNKQTFGFIALAFWLISAHAIAADPAPAAKDAHDAAAKDTHAAPAKDAKAAAPKDAHAAPAKEAKATPAKDAHAESAKDAHGAAPKDDSAAADAAPAKPEPKAEPKAAAQKPKRKKAKAQAEAKAGSKGHSADKGAADHHADAAPPVPAAIEPTTRVRTRDRAAATGAVSAEQASAAHDAPSSAHADAPATASVPEKKDEHGAAHNDHQAAPVSAAKQDAGGAKAADAHHADAPPSVPADIEPTQRQRVRSTIAVPAPAAPAAHADSAAHDDQHAAVAHGAASNAGHDTKAAAKDSAGHDAHHDAKKDTGHAAKSLDTQAASAPAGEECNPPLKAEIASLFDRWNASLRTGDPRKVVANYAPDSVLLPTVSNRARFTIAEKEDYFMHFLQRRPQGYIDDRMIDVDCNSATDSGLYTFRFSDGTSVKARYSFSYKKINGQWLITSHHSSGMPEKPEAHSAAHADAHAAPKATDSGSSTKGWVRFP
jgi:uncharacterized protein (TIGR02246 family)